MPVLVGIGTAWVGRSFGAALCFWGGALDFTMYSGDTKRLRYTLTDGDSAPLDISDAEVRWEASRGNTGRFSSTPVLTKTIGAGIEITDEINGLLTVELLPSDTETLRGTYYYELQIEDASGDVATASTGQFTVKPSLVK